MTEPTWEDKATEHAHMMSRKIQDVFEAELAGAMLSVPNIVHLDGTDARVRALEIFIVDLLKTSTMLCARYASSDPRFEANTIAVVKDAFEDFRSLKKKGVV